MSISSIKDPGLKKSGRKVAAGFAAVIAAIGLGLLGGSSALADEPEPDTQLEQLSAEENALLNADEPVTITVDVETGEFLTVEATSDDELTAYGAHAGNCSAGMACWHESAIPYQFIGFDGSGAT